MTKHNLGGSNARERRRLRRCGYRENGNSRHRDGLSEAATTTKSALDTAGTQVPGIIGAVGGATSGLAKSGPGALTRASAGAGTIAGKLVEVVGDTMGTISSHATARLSRTSGVESEKGADFSLAPQRPNRRSSILRSPTIWGTAAFAGLAVPLVIWVHNAYLAADIIGTSEAFIAAVLLFSGFFWFNREISAWRRLGVAQELQEALSNECRTAADEARFRAAMGQLRRAAQDASLVEFFDSADSHAEPATLRRELDQIGLSTCDANAIEAIRRSTRDVFFLSLLSANALFDTAAFSIRALGMIRSVAGVYGHRPGRIATLRLTRHILADIALLPVGMLIAEDALRSGGSAVRHVARAAVAAGQLATNIPEPHHLAVGAAVSLGGVAVDAIADVVERVTPRVADAALAAGRMGHLGLLAVAHVRPLCMSWSRYRAMRYALLKTILRLRKDAERQKKELRA